jgi:flagellar motor switch protein FliM
MEKDLGQSAIDALFASANAAADGGLPNPPPLADSSIEAYNFSRAGQISNDQVRAIGTVNDMFARNLMHTVSAWLRTEFQVALASGEQMAYSEFVDRIPDRTYVASVRLEPLGAPGLIEVELALASPIVDLLLGGTGTAEPERPLTDIEDLIMASVVQMIVKELNVAWQPVGLHFTFDKRESSSQVARMMPAGEKTMCVCFEVKMPEARGVLNLCLPSVVLNTILRKLIAEHSRPRRRSAEMKERVRELVAETTVGAVLQFPPVHLHARELAALAPGTILRLPIPRHAPGELRVGGLALGRARAVRMGEHRGAQLEAPGRAEHDSVHATALPN